MGRLSPSALRRRHAVDRDRPTRAQVEAFRAVAERMQAERAAALHRPEHDEEADR